jgi:hypothetical protein
MIIQNKPNLKIIEYINGKINYKNGGHKKIFVKLKCICGKEFIIRIVNYKYYSSCGCLKGYNLKIDNNKNLPEGEVSFRKIFNTYKQNSNKKQRGFNLTLEEFKKLINELFR